MALVAFQIFTDILEECSSPVGKNALELVTLGDENDENESGLWQRVPGTGVVRRVPIGYSRQVR